MSIQLRQICLVGEYLQPVVEDLTTILGINVCYIDPDVAEFGLENSLMPIGRNFLEVVAPIKANTAAGRYLARRKGDGGYMVSQVLIFEWRIAERFWRRQNGSIAMYQTIKC